MASPVHCRTSCAAPFLSPSRNPPLPCPCSLSLWVSVQRIKERRERAEEGEARDEERKRTKKENSKKVWVQKIKRRVKKEKESQLGFDPLTKSNPIWASEQLGPGPVGPNCYGHPVFFNPEPPHLQSMSILSPSYYFYLIWLLFLIK